MEEKIPKEEYMNFCYWRGKEHISYTHFVPNYTRSKSKSKSKLGGASVEGLKIPPDGPKDSLCDYLAFV